jgi:LacI family transcriptional regulator
MSVCYDIGIRIPDDLSIIGYDDIEHSRHASPPLTTVRVDKELMGRLAVRHLYSQMYPEAALPESPKLARNGIPVELVVRESCRAI